jgi:probable O-glycosylation ligase (exosortase A-associated)
MRMLLVLCFYALGAGLGMRAVVFAAALFLWSDIFQPLEFAKNPGRFPVAYFVLAALLAAYVSGWFRGKFKPRFGPYFYLLCGLMAWVGFTALISPYRDVAMEQFVLYLKYLLPLAIIHTAIASQADIKILSAVLAGSVGVWAAQAGVFTLANGARTDLGIPGGQMADRNDFAAAIVGTIPVLIYFMTSYDWKFKIPVRIGLALATGLSLCAIFFSLSRGASLGLAAQLMLYLGYVSKRKIRDVILIAIAGGILVFFLPESWYERMSTINVGTEQTEGSAKARMNLIMGAWHASLDYPVFGLGPGGWLEVAEAYTGDNHNPHNIYLVLTSETGFPGLALYLLLVAFTYVRVSRTISNALKRGDKQTARLGSALITAIFGLLSAMTFLNRPFNEYLWAWLAIANALPEIESIRAGRKPEAKAARGKPSSIPNAGIHPRP